jgi:hypothetical protein
VKTSTVYLVEWEGFGFYAGVQASYQWCFTPDPELATQYRTVKAARAAAERACSNRFGNDQPSARYRIVEARLSLTIVNELP